MRKVAWGALLAIALLLLVAPPSDAHSHFRGRVFIGVGPGWWGPPWWYYPPYPPYVYAPPPTVVVQQPPVYVQQEAPPPPPAPPQVYWYYCASARGYYPNVPSCPEPWVRVLPRTE